MAATRHTQEYCKSCRKKTLHVWSTADDIGCVGCLLWGFATIFTLGLALPFLWFHAKKSARGRCNICGTRN